MAIKNVENDVKKMKKKQKRKKKMGRPRVRRPEWWVTADDVILHDADDDEEPI